MIGLFDSGVGGLTVLRRLRELLPAHDMLYFADQANVPYGDRTPEDLHRLAELNLAWLDAAGVRAIVIACNTSCATAAQLGWPRTQAPVLDLIESAAIAAERSGAKRFGVIATAATARSGAYSRAIRQRVRGACVIEVPAPALVPLVEAGELNGVRTRAAVAQACATLTGNVDAVLLGCTHYPLLLQHFTAVFGDEVPVIDPAVVHAQRAAQLVSDLAIAPGVGRLECVTTGDAAAFAASLQTLAADLTPAIRSLKAA
jgi:glutamate racemase